MAAKILVVDDQENMCWILSKVLAEAGFAVETARSGKEALSRVAEGEITAAIVDYRLPDMNGIQLLNRMKNVASHIAAIALTKEIFIARNPLAAYLIVSAEAGSVTITGAVIPR